MEATIEMEAWDASLKRKQELEAVVVWQTIQQLKKRLAHMPGRYAAAANAGMTF